MKTAVIWSKDNCPGCLNALKMLEAFGYSVEVRKLGTDYSVADLQKVVPGARSVPQVFINDGYVGGLEEVKEFLLTGASLPPTKSQMNFMLHEHV